MAKITLEAIRYNGVYAAADTETRVITFPPSAKLQILKRKDVSEMSKEEFEFYLLEPATYRRMESGHG